MFELFCSLQHCLAMDLFKDVNHGYFVVNSVNTQRLCVRVFDKNHNDYRFIRFRVLFYRLLRNERKKQLLIRQSVLSRHRILMSATLLYCSGGIPRFCSKSDQTTSNLMAIVLFLLLGGKLRTWQSMENRISTIVLCCCCCGWRWCRRLDACRV